MGESEGSGHTFCLDLVALGEGEEGRKEIGAVLLGHGGMRDGGRGRQRRRREGKRNESE